MFREYVKGCRDRKAVVKVVYTNGLWTEGVIEQIGPEAITLRRKTDRAVVLAMKCNIACITPKDNRKKEA
jgi:sRNA-binding regulator protein Hfq